MSFNEIQKQVSSLVGTSASALAYLDLHKAAHDISETIPDYIKKPRLAFLSNFTIQGLPEVLKIRGVFHNLWPEIYLGPYDQTAQEILNDKSGLYAFKPDLIYLFIDFKTLPANEIKKLVDQLLLRTQAKIVIFNQEALSSYQNNKQIHLFNFDEWLNETGHKKDWYTKYKDLGDLRLAPDAFPDLAEPLLGFAVAVSGATKKCIVLDLDNTLWRGILGEDGLENIKPRKELQKFLSDILTKGIILAINSRNNEDEALKAIESHPDMILRKKDFADWQINWVNKVQNMTTLAESLNLGIDSFVFLDDDEFQLNLIREAFPQIATISAQDEKTGLNFLKNYAGFSKLEITKEDLKRSQMYAEERQRKPILTSFKTVKEFLKELDLKVYIKDVKENDEEALVRAAQLTQKTNQFNLTTKRYSELAIKHFIKRGWKVWTISATDKFGDYGIIGLIMVDTTESYWKIDNFLMSCRILGRGIEDEAFKFIFDQAGKNKTIFASYKYTSKNIQAKDFWSKRGLTDIRNVPKEVLEKHGFKYSGYSANVVRGQASEIDEEIYCRFL